MKKALPFLITLLSGASFFIPHQKSENSCLFYFQNKCYTCDEEDVFFVGLPENCKLCPNKKEKYIESDNKTFWGCLPETFDEENNKITHLPQLDNQGDCPKNYPLKDILGHCYTCQTEQAVQIDGFDYSACQGKRYLTKFRNSSKSNLCPDTEKIKDPEICFACHGKWIHEKCVNFSFEEPTFCQNNLDCDTNQYCYPFTYSIYHKNGICRLSNSKKWFYSKKDGYTYEDADIFCQRQNAHIPTLNELNEEKTELLNLIQNSKIWVHFDEGMLYLDSLNSDIITQEKISIVSGGDNTYALCRKN